MFEEYYKTKLAEIFDSPLEAEDGLSSEEIKSKLIEAELTIIPQALFEYYLLVGNLHCDDMLLPINLLGLDEETQGILVFMVDPQNVGRYGILKSDLDKPDPDVWGQDEGDTEWFQVGEKLSEFIVGYL